MQQHEQISNITLQLQQIEQNKQKDSQLRSRISPFSSIDNPSPLATIKENLTQFKSLLPPNSNIPSTTTSSQTDAVDFLSFLSFFQNLWNPAIILPNPTVYLNKILSPPDEKTIPALPVPPLITYEETRSDIKTLNQNSAPGLDGFTANFYSSFPDGSLSNSIPVKCGIRQGCPLSMLLFLISIKPLT